MMRILVAEDDIVSRTLLERILRTWDFDVCAAGDGTAAWEMLRADAAPRLAILDWMMPGMDGTEVCRRVRDLPAVDPAYLILLTARADKSDIVRGLDSGADDYITKPFDPGELHARLRVGMRTLDLRRSLISQGLELEAAERQVKHLKRMLPFCAHCKLIRDDYEYLQMVQNYMASHAHLHVEHAVCPKCYATTVQPNLDCLWNVMQASSPAGL